jgi:hypothetical protein
MEGSETRRLGRRALLAAGAAGVAAAAAQAVAPASVRAVDGDVMRVGQILDGTATTVVHATNHALEGRSDTGDGLRGETNAAAKSGVYGYSKHPDGYGVYGSNLPSGALGILGTKGQGVMGSAADAEGVRGESSNNNGVAGKSGGKAKAGVLGEATNTDGLGVQGRNTVSHTYGFLGGKENGLYGASPVTGGAAVLGEHSHPGGAAVYGSNTATHVGGGLGVMGVGVMGNAPSDLDHWALVASGRAGFSRSGLLTIAAGKSSTSATVPALTAGAPMPSLVLATLQTNRAGVYIQAAVASPGSNKITIYLNKKVTAATKVAYFVLN